MLNKDSDIGKNDISMSALSLSIVALLLVFLQKQLLFLYFMLLDQPLTKASKGSSLCIFVNMQIIILIDQ